MNRLGSARIAALLAAAAAAAALPSSLPAAMTALALAGALALATASRLAFRAIGRVVCLGAVLPLAAAAGPHPNELAGLALTVAAVAAAGMRNPQWLKRAASATGMLALAAAYGHGASGLYQLLAGEIPAQGMPLVLQAAQAFAAAGALLAAPGRALTWLTADSSDAARVLRRILPIGVALPIASGISHLTLYHMGVGFAPAEAFVGLALAGGITALVLYVARMLEASQAGLREASERRLRRVADALADPLCGVDAGGVITFVNDALCRLSGQGAADLVGTDAARLFHNAVPDDCPLRASLRDGQPRRVETEELRRRDGTPVPVSLSVNPVAGPDGTVSEAIVILADITERKRIEAENASDRGRIEDELRVLTRAVEQNPGPIIITDPDGTIEYVNPRFTEITGYSVAEARGNNPRMLKSGKVPPEVYQRMWSTILSGGTWHGEFCNRRKDGQEYWAAASITGIRDPSGRITHFVGVTEDITGRKALEADLTAKRNLLRTVIDSLPDEIWAKDRELRFTLANASRASRYGVPSPRVLIGFDDADFLPPEAAASRLAGERQILESAQPLINQEYAYESDGGTRWGSRTVVPLFEPDGGVVGLVGIERDITPAKDFESNLERSRDAAEAANRAKSQFLANMSHEIRTPMNAIVGLGDLLRRESDPSRREDYLGRIDTAARLLLELISDILDLSKIEEGRLELERATFRLGEVAVPVDELCGARARAKGLSWNCSVPPGPGPLLEGDPTRLRQVLLNLCGNAVKFTEAGSVSLNLRLDNPESPTPRLECSVTDTGIGLPQGAEDWLFQPFTQADASISRRFGGTGLGLAICRRLVELMGGTVAAERRPPPAGGTLFRISVPLALASAASANAPEPAAAPLPRLTGRRILVVEDNEANTIVVKAMLEDAGAVVDSASDGLAALDMAGQVRPDLVLMDLQMPGLDGYETARRLREAWGTTAPPIVALSANAQHQDRERAREAGMVDYLVKPVRQAPLVEHVARWIMAPGQAGPADAPEPEPTPAGASPATGPIDFVEGLARSIGKPAVYTRVLAAFAAGAAGAAHQLTAALATGDRETAIRTVHSLKGAAGNAGARELMGTAAELEAELRAGATPPLDKLARFAELAAAAAAAAVAWVPPETAPAEPPTTESGPSFAEAIARLAVLIGQGDAAALELAASLMGQAPDNDTRQALAAVKTALDRFDFTAAAASLPARPNQTVPGPG